MNYYILSSLSVIMSLLTVFQPMQRRVALTNPMEMPMPMCHSTGDGMAAFVDDPKFVALHPAPRSRDGRQRGILRAKEGSWGRVLGDE